VPNVDRALVRLREDHALWARKCARILNKRKRLVPLELFPWQESMQAKLREQREAEKPERIIILKARQLGFSTDVQATFTQRCTLIPYQAALTVAHDLETAGKLFEIGQRIYNNLPDDPRLKPALTHERDSKGGMKYMRWANGSTYEVETAGDIRGGRGTTPFLLHLSEIAHYEKTDALIGLLNGVPDEPGSLIVQESTANGRNHFEDTWNDAVKGINGYAYIFVAWWEMPEYSLAFEDEWQREELEQSIGKGEIGEEEPMLLERFGLSLEQLNWRRYTIRAKLKSSPTLFKQEYPSYPEEAFLVSGRPVFSVAFTSRVLARVQKTDPLAPAPRRDDCPKPPSRDACVACGQFHGPDVGILKDVAHKTVKTREGTIDVPTKVIFVPIEATGFNPHVHPTWAVWEHPIDPTSTDDLEPDRRPPYRPGQYVEGIDVAGGEEMTSQGDPAWHAIQIIGHVTKRQVARWRARIDPHELTREAVLAGIYWNYALLAVEITGGWGWPIARAAHRHYRYPHLYRRKSIGGKAEKQQDRLGWHTTSETRPDMIGFLEEQLAEGSDGIVDRLTADELTTFVYDERGRAKPERDHFSDLIMARMVAGAVARELRPRPNRRPGDVPTGR
jgi:hypothetical protein